MPVSEVAAFWQNEGRVHTLAGNAPFVLDDSDGLWLVESGSVDVFSFADIESNRRGPRRHLWSVEPGGALLSFGAQVDGTTHRLLAVCTPGTRLRSLSMARVEALAQQPEVQPAIVAILDHYVARMCASLQGSARPQLHAVLKPGEAIGLEREQNAGTIGEILWVRHESGASFFAGLEDLRLGPNDGPLPLGRGFWLKAATEDLRLSGIDTRACLERGEAFLAVQRLRSLFLIWATREAKRDDDVERERLRRKGAAGDRMREQGIAGLATVVADEPVERAMAQEEDRLLGACRVVGRLDGIEFKAPPKWETESRVKDPLAAICRASRIRSRRVKLDGDWWKHDNGNLVGFMDESGEPVALIHRKGGYELLSPADMSRKRVTREVAKTLNWEGFCFYRPFPDQPITGKDLLRRAAHDLRHELRFVLLMALCAGLLGLVVPMATEKMFGTVVPSSQSEQVVMLLLGLVGVHVGIALFDLARAFTLVRIEGKSNSSLQAAVVDRLLALPVPFFRKYPVGELAMRALTINVARSVLTGAASVTVLSGVFSLLYFLLMVYYNWRLALLALVVFLLSIGFVLLFAKPAVRHERQSLAIQGTVGALVFQMISGIAKLRVAGAEGRIFAKWAVLFAEQTKLKHRARSHQNVVKVFNDTLPLLASLALFGTAGYLLNSGHEINTARFIAFSAAYGAMFASVVQLSDTVINVMNVQPIVERARPILETVPEVEAFKPDPGELSGGIEACHLSFAYKEDGPIVLDDVSFYAEAGEYVAIVGASGSGKSTALRMLLGFEQPSSGSVYYDGQDLSTVNISGVRSQIGVVLQNSRLIAGTVFDNLVGSAPLTMDDAWEAAEMAGLADDIKEMPMGMHTVVAEGGANLSGGQQQRLLISRALVRKPRLIFFDEATSALDNLVQEQVSQSLDRLSATRIVIAHRLSTIRHADRIYVMERGKVIQSGGFAELASQPGVFADLMARQML
jgi:NHLM bacteriocin system ABC transporter ATP-binding protein